MTSFQLAPFENLRAFSSSRTSGLSALREPQGFQLFDNVRAFSFIEAGDFHRSAEEN